MLSRSPIALFGRGIWTTACLLRRHARGERRANVGLSRQLKEFQDDLEIFNADPEGFEDLESTLLEANKSHRAHEEEMQKRRDYIRRCIVKRKYFRSDPLPNFLTYAEKERIRLLWNGPDAEEWSCERLADSFPALPASIQKVATSDWRPLTNKRIVKHDAQVAENWQALKSGQLDKQLSQELKDHLSKFSDRTNLQRTEESVAQEFLKAKPMPKAPKTNEFRAILGDREERQQLGDGGPVDSEEESQGGEAAEQSSSTMLKSRLGKEPMRLKDFRDASLALETGRETTHQHLPTASQHLPKWNEELELRAAGQAPVEITFSAADLKTYEINAVKQRICIPRKLWRRGALYRIDDCYYDDDGEFLYRLIGMHYGSSAGK